MIEIQFIRQIEVTPSKEVIDGNYSLGVINKDRQLMIGVEEKFDKKAVFKYQYYMSLQFVVVNQDTKEQKHFDMQSLTETVVIEIHSKALGDQIAWMPFVDLFQKKHGCKVVVRCHFVDLFEPHYANLEFAKQYFKGTTEKLEGENILAQATYCLGYDVTGKDTKISPVDCRTIPLQHVAAYQLGLEPKEVRTSLKSNISKPIIEGKYIVICTCGTATFKIWNNPKGWPETISFLRSKGYKIIDVGDSTDSLEGTISYNGILPWNEIMNIIEHAQMFLSASNGLMWLAWATGQKKIVTINNITARGTEFEHTKVDNKAVCNSCWNSTEHVFENDNINYCPRNQDFICSKSITPEMVIGKIKEIL